MGLMVVVVILHNITYLMYFVLLYIYIYIAYIHANDVWGVILILRNTVCQQRV